MPRQLLPNIGFVKNKLNSEALNKLKSYIKNKKDKDKANSNLAGNLSNSFYLKDKNNWFFNNVLMPLIYEYGDDVREVVPRVLTKDCRYFLNEMWVNYQNKYEFNPTHNHTGVYSFVVWLEIPSSHKKEKKLNFIKESNSPCPNTFEFIYTNILGKVCSEHFYLEPEDEGTILLFPATLIHQVYPFYLSNKQRVSVSGNIALNPKQII